MQDILRRLMFTLSLLVGLNSLISFHSKEVMWPVHCHTVGWWWWWWLGGWGTDSVFNQRGWLPQGLFPCLKDSVLGSWISLLSTYSYKCTERNKSVQDLVMVAYKHWRPFSVCILSKMGIQRHRNMSNFTYLVLLENVLIKTGDFVVTAMTLLTYP